MASSLPLKYVSLIAIAACLLGACTTNASDEDVDEAAQRRRPTPSPTPSNVCGGTLSTESTFKMTCQLEEHLSLPTKGEHCAPDSTARVVYLSNCTIPATGDPNNTLEWMKNGIALTTYLPGVGCWSGTEHSLIDALGLNRVAPGTKVEVSMGQFRAFGGKGSAGGFVEDVHQLGIAGRTACTTDHAINTKNQSTGVPHTLWMVNPENPWLRETK
jgi:hypothetical protein